MTSDLYQTASPGPPGNAGKEGAQTPPERTAAHLRLVHRARCLCNFEKCNKEKLGKTNSCIGVVGF